VNAIKIDSPTSPSATEMMISVALFGTTALIVQERASVELSRETCGSQQRTFERDSECVLWRMRNRLSRASGYASQSDTSPAEGRRTLSMFALATRPWATAQSAAGASGWRASPTQTTGRASTPSCGHPPLSRRQTLVRSRSSIGRARPAASGRRVTVSGVSLRSLLTACKVAPGLW
jgi:hypothetical protein